MTNAACDEEACPKSVLIGVVERTRQRCDRERRPCGAVDLEHDEGDLAGGTAFVAGSGEPFERGPQIAELGEEGFESGRRRRRVVVCAPRPDRRRKSDPRGACPRRRGETRPQTHGSLRTCPNVAILIRLDDGLPRSSVASRRAPTICDTGGAVGKPSRSTIASAA